MNWLKSIWAASGTAVLAMLAVFAVASAQRQKRVADKWKDKALDIELGNVSRGTLTAKAANSQAKVHEQKAKERNKKALAHMKKAGENNAPVADVLDAFRRSS